MDINELCRKYVECVDEIAHLTARLDEVSGNLKALRLLYAAAVETRDHVLGAIAVAANRSAGYSVPTPAEPTAPPRSDEPEADPDPVGASTAASVPAWPAWLNQGAPEAGHSGGLP